ncbi:GNAT family N-acetyltransferase [Neobacillus mesonae]|nr:GNAT family N-acetyltransferase [Neobacillus mesonae]
MKIQIKQAKADQLHIVHRMMREAFEEYRDVLFPPSGALIEEVVDIQRKIEVNNGGAILVWLNDEPVGSAQYYVKEDYLYIGRVSVIKKARGNGIGKQIIQYFERFGADQEAGWLRIGVRLSIPENITFYKKLGFEVTEEHEYPEKTDRWYIMTKRIVHKS